MTDTNYYFDSPLIFNNDKVGYIDIMFTLTPNVTEPPTTHSSTTHPSDGGTSKPKYKIYLTNRTNKTYLLSAFTTLEPDFKLNFDFYDSIGSSWAVIYNFSKWDIEQKQSFIESMQWNEYNNIAYTDIVLNSDGYKLTYITKDVSYNNLVIYDCTNGCITTNNNLISIDASGILFHDSTDSNKMVGYIYVCNSLSSQSYLNISYNSYIQ